MSKLIEINDEIAQNLLVKGFHHTKNNKFLFNAKLHTDILKFIEAYNNLEIDSYVLESGGIPYRKRKYGSCTLDISDPKNSQLIANEHQSFFQSKEENSLYGGIDRKFSPIEVDILNNNFLRELIKINFEYLPKIDKSMSKQWFVGVQMFRIEATDEYEGLPSPEGIHQDGHYFVIQHMINKRNIEGGESLIFNLDKEKISNIMLEDFMDTCYVKDTKVMHDVTKVTCSNNEKKGSRDMLILDYKLLSQE